MSKELTGVMHILSVLVRELEPPKSISQQAPGDTGSCPSWIPLTSPAAAAACSCYRSHASASQLTSFELCLTVPGVLLQALLLIDDDVLDVLHRQVVTEGVEQNVFQLLQGDSLHVELQEDTRNGFIKVLSLCC